jgi:hypothetical protein
MNHASAADHFARFLTATGHRVVRTESAHWYDASRLCWLSLPSHRLLDPPREELREVLRRGRCLGARFPAPLEGRGKVSYQIVCEDREYRLDHLSANVRSKVRRGLRRCEVRRVPFDELAARGLAADRDTLARQGRLARLSRERWPRYWSAAAATPGMEGWAAFVAGEMAAFLVTVQFDDCVEFLLARSRSDLLQAYPNNALLFVVTEEMLVRRRVRAITFGLESLEPVGPLDQFKFSMGFHQRPIRQRVVFHPLVGVLMRMRPLRTGVYRWARHHGAEGAFWKKAAGLLRFAEESGIEAGS